MNKKRWIVWTMIAALLFSLVPAAMPVPVQAATTTYFIPDDPVLEKSASLVNSNDYANTLVRSNVLSTTSSNLTLTGVFNYVSSNSLSVRVEQLVFQSDDKSSSSAAKWTTTPDRVYNSAATADAGFTNRFTASNVKLFSGYNRITFSGMQGTVQRSETFYVLYDQVPYLTTLKVTTGASDPVELSEGASIVVATDQVSLQGIAPNASSVSIKVRDEAVAIQASIQDDGLFFSPALTLVPGKNIIYLSISSPSSTINITRTLYYYDQDRPFSELTVNHGTDGKQSLLNNNIPRLADSTAGAQATFTMELILPDTGTPFATSGEVYANDPADPAVLIPTTIAVGGERAVASKGGLPAYRIITLTTGNYAFKTDGNGKPLIDQNVRFSIKYGTLEAAINTAFIYVPNEVVIRGIYLLKDYKETDVIDVTIPRPNLDGTEVPSSDFYILVNAASAISDKSPTITLLPFRTQALPVTEVANKTVVDANGTPSDNTWMIYKVEGLPDGNQDLSFVYPNSSLYAEFKARVARISQNYISIDNLYDGQTFRFKSNSTAANYLPAITGQYVGFDTGLDLSSVSLTINGKAFPNFDDKVHATTFKIDTGAIAINNTVGPLTFGENTLIFSGNYSRNGAVRTIIKQLRIYIIDTNVATIDAFQPATIPSDTSGRVPFSTTMTNADIDRVFYMSNDIQYNNNKYITSLKSYDLVAKGSGATKAVIKRGSEVLFDLSLSVTTTTYVNQTPAITGLPSFDFTGSQSGFLLRIRGLQFESPGEHGYTLELTNGTGAVVSQTLTLQRVVSSFRILSPQPNVGNSYVVSKNFIHFDIEAEGAAEVTIGGQVATKRKDTVADRFVLDYIGLKPDKANDLKIVVKRDSGQPVNTSISVYYTSAVDVDSQYMEKIANKHSVFNGELQLSFPKGTVLKSAPNNNLFNNNNTSIVKYYQDTKLLFGVASPTDGVVGRKNDYGNVMGLDKDKGSYQENVTVIIPTGYVSSFNNQMNRSNFTRVSKYYWISAGYGESGTPGTSGYREATSGVTPYSYEIGSSTPLFFTDPVLSGRKIVPSQRGSLTLSYNPSVVDSAGTNVTVFFYNDQKEWVNLGGVVDTKKNTITVPFDDFGYYMVGKLSYSFQDVTNHGWARNILDALFSKGIMPSLRFNTFGAEDQTSRGEFATLLVKALNLPLNYDGNATYFDITPTAKSLTWDYQHIETASRAGIVTGLDNRYFGADVKVTREQAATMIARALELKLSINDSNQSNSKLASNLAKSFTDSTQIEFYARPAVEAVNKAGIMVGLPNELQVGQKKETSRFDPKATMTRAQAAQIAVRLLQKHTKMFPSNLN